MLWDLTSIGRSQCCAYAVNVVYTVVHLPFRERFWWQRWMKSLCYMQQTEPTISRDKALLLGTTLFGSLFRIDAYG